MRRSRNSDIPIKDDPIVIDEPSKRDLEIFEILYWHKFLPSSWIRHFFPTAAKNQHFITHLGSLREKQNAYLKWCDWPLNYKGDKTRTGVYELALKGAKAIGHPVPPTVKDQDVPHDFIVSLHEASLRFQARDAGLRFVMLPADEYDVNGHKWNPDGHPIRVGEECNDVLIHSEIERRKWKESPEDTEAKLDKAYHYVKDGHYNDDANSALCLFLCTTIGRKNALMAYTKERFGSTTFFGFATTSDWVREGKYPPPSPPLVPEWERVGYPPLKLENFIKGGA